MTFKKWVSMFTGVDSKIGDVARHAEGDEHFPETSSKSEMLRYYESTDVGEEYIPSFLLAWTLYVGDCSAWAKP